MLRSNIPLTPGIMPCGVIPVYKWFFKKIPPQVMDALMITFPGYGTLTGTSTQIFDPGRDVMALYYGAVMCDMQKHIV